VAPESTAAPATPPGPSASDLALLAEVATTLADGVDAALPGWVQRSVDRVWRAQRGAAPPAEVTAAAAAAAAEAAAQVCPRVRALLALDIDEQRTNPLSLVRPATRFPTGVLAGFGVEPVVRDAQAVRQFPDDPYDLTPMSFADLDPELLEAGIVWGAAKAHVHLARRRAEGRR